jgi:hypothetical protein
MGKEASVIPFLDVLATKEETSLNTTVHRKPVDTGRYLHFDPNHPLKMQKCLIQTL